MKLKDSHGYIISSNCEVAAKFNDYFSDIASNVKADNGRIKIFDLGRFSKFFQSPTANSIHLRPTDAGEVFSIIKK